MKRLLACTLFGCALSLPLLAEDTPKAPSPEEQAMMEAYEKMGRVGEPHKQLARMVGEWTYENHMWMEPGKPASVSTGTSTSRATWEGRYIETLFKGDYQGQPFEGKAIAGYDNLKGKYDSFAIPANAPGPVTTTTYSQKISELSKRFGVLFQPNELHSYHFSYGTSFNTSGDTYSYNAQSANTDPESSENIELGAKLDSADKRFTTRLALFRSTKTNERNTDPDTAATRLLLSGKRHSAGVEIDITGRLSANWEVYGSYMWMPIAKVDKAASTATTVGNRVGDRPGLSPKHSGTVWTTYQITPQWRVGGGLNFRSKQAAVDVTAPAWEAPSFVTADLMAEYAINQQLTMKANLTNATNKLYGESLYRGHYIPGAGRLFQVSLSAKF